MACFGRGEPTENAKDLYEWVVNADGDEFKDVRNNASCYPCLPIGKFSLPNRCVMLFSGAGNRNNTLKTIKYASRDCGRAEALSHHNHPGYCQENGPEI